MMTPIFRRDDCRLCGGRDIELVVALSATPIGANYVTAERLDEDQQSYPIELYLCLNCGYAGLLDVVAPEILFNDSTEITSISLGVIENLQQLAGFVSDRVSPAKNSLVVDIGSNDGTLLGFFKSQNMKVLGVEPAHFAAQKATERGIQTLGTVFSFELASKIRKEHGPATVITATRVFANIDDLTDTIHGIVHLLSADGVFVFETGYLVDIMQDLLFETIYHEHLSYDCAKPLDSFFRNYGMELIDIERISIKGGSLRGVVQLAGGSRPVSPSVAKMLEHELSLGYDRPEIFGKFTSRLDGIKTGLNELLSDLKSNGKTVAGYGASVGSTTMIYHFGLGDALTFIADDDPRNQNLYSPGYHIPVVASEALYDSKPDYVVILAWRYAQAIITKHQRYLDQGGHFIVPMPQVEVI